MADQPLPETYCLGLLVSELGETLQVLGNALRFGIDTPDKREAVARYALAAEVGDVLAAIDFTVLQGVIDSGAVAQARHNKLRILLDPSAVDNLKRRLAPALPTPVAPAFEAPKLPVVKPVPSSPAVEAPEAIELYPVENVPAVVVDDRKSGLRRRDSGR